MGHIFSKSLVKQIVFPFIKFNEPTYHGSEWYQVEDIDQNNFEKYFKTGTLVDLNLEESEGNYGHCYSKDKYGNEISLFMFGVDEDTVTAVEKILFYEECYNNLKNKMLSISTDSSVPFWISKEITDTIKTLDKRIKEKINGTI